VREMKSLPRKRALRPRVRVGDRRGERWTGVCSEDEDRKLERERLMLEFKDSRTRMAVPTTGRASMSSGGKIESSSEKVREFVRERKSRESPVHRRVGETSKSFYGCGTPLIDSFYTLGGEKAIVILLGLLV
jgi:hypothetical protein